MSLTNIGKPSTVNFFKKCILVVSFLCCSVIGHSQAPAISSFSPTSAATSGAVTITGSFMNLATGVSFGGVPAGFFYVTSSTSLTAFVGSGASGDVTVSGTNGSSSLPGFTFLPPPQINSFSPVMAGSGDTVFIRGIRFAGAAGVYFGNTAAVSFIVESDTVIKALVGNGTSGSVMVHVQALGTATMSGFTHTGPYIYTMSPTAGPGGTVVKLYGKNFLHTSDVEVGGVPATTFNVISADTVSFETPPGAAGTITLTTPYGYATVQNFNKTGVLTVAPFFGTPGDTIYIRGFNLTGASTVTFASTPAASFVVSGDTLIMAVLDTLPVAGNTPVSVTTPAYGTGTYPGSFYYNHPIPVINSMYPTLGGPGTVITFKGKRYNGVSAVRFGNTLAASFSVLSDSVLTAVVANGSSGMAVIENSFGGGSISGFTFVTLPTVTSFSPLSGAPGTQVAIRGVNFSGTNNNKVFFGPVKAPVLSSSDTLIKVTVPFGGGTQPFTVTNDSSIGYAPKSFKTTFAGDSFFTRASFSSKLNFHTAREVKIIADFDDDGKPDMAGIGDGNTFDSSKIYIFKNNSITGAITFDTLQTSPVGIRGEAKFLAAGDLDADGRPDIVIAYHGGSICILKNTSTAGNISFAAPYLSQQPFASGRYTDIAICDLNQDGKPDIALTAEDDNYLFIFKNTTTNGVISFSNVVGSNLVFHLPLSVPVKLAAADIDGDKKIDLVVGAAYYNTSFGSGPGLVVMHNTSNNGGFSFTTTNLFYDQGSTESIDIADIDGDEKPDMVVTGRTSTELVSIFKNVSVNSPLFTLVDTFRVGRRPRFVRLADMNGDKKRDILLLNNTREPVYSNYSFTVLKNKTETSGPPVFDTAVYIYHNRQISDMWVNDLDLDGKPDVVVSDYFSYNDSMITILRNQAGPNQIQLCPPVSSGSIQSSIPGSTWQWQINTGSGFRNLTNSGTYAGTTAAILQLNNITSNMYGTAFRCLVDGTKLTDPVEIRFRNTWRGNVSTAWENAANWSCGSVPDAYTDVIINSGTITINSNITIGSLTASDNAVISVTPGFTVTLTR